MVNKHFMKKLILILILLFSNIIFSQQIMESNYSIVFLNEEEWLKVDKILSEESPENINLISPIDLLRYLATENHLSNSNIKSSKYFIPKSWIKKSDVNQLMLLINSDKKSRQLTNSMACCAESGYSTVGFEAMHLINLYKIENYNYPTLSFLMSEVGIKSQIEMIKDYENWWSEQ